MNLNKAITPKKFNEIKSYFTVSIPTKVNSKKQLKKQISHHNLKERPKLAKTTNKLKIKRRELSNMLEQIGKEDDIFSDDKLITNIKIETIEYSLRQNPINSLDIDKSFMSKRTTRPNPPLVSLKKNIKKKKYSKQNLNKENETDINNTTLELNCNKMPYSNDISKLTLMKKTQIRSNQNSRTKLLYKIKKKNIYIKNVDQFINKPNNDAKTGTSKLLISPLSKPSPLKFKHKSKILKNYNLHLSQRNSKPNINNNVSQSLASNSKDDISKSFVHGKSMKEKTSSNYMHFPSKSIIKNQAKVIIELQKLFGDKLQLSNDTYKNMNDFDKINSINFLLETIKEMSNINKSNKSKIDGYRELNENKEKQIKEQKAEIKGLKKELIKINKLVKTNIQLNKKLEQNIETLKSQLEKEKQKNKTLNKEKGNSSSKNFNSDFNLKFKNEKITNKIKHKKLNKSQDIVKKANIYINQGNNENKNINENNINKNINQNNINVKTNINIIIKNKEEKKNEDKEKSLSKSNEENNQNS